MKPAVVDFQFRCLCPKGHEAVVQSGYNAPTFHAYGGCSGHGDEHCNSYCEPWVEFGWDCPECKQSYEAKLKEFYP